MKQALFVVALGLVATVVAAQAPERVEPIVALDIGNRLAADGQWHDAIDAYLRGWDPRAPHPTLAYNLGAAFHQTQQLPEAILWYRRVSTDDPWVDENLLLARRSLGSQRLPLHGPVGWLQAHGQSVTIAAILGAWLALALVVAGGRRSGLVIAGLTLVLYGTVVANDVWGPRQAVLLDACDTPDGEFPAGTEVWVRSNDQNARILGTDGSCPSESVALIEPASG